jgi:hypothetical protein
MSVRVRADRRWGINTPSQCIQICFVWLGVEKRGAHETMVTRGVMFRVIVAEVFGAWSPIYEELSLLFTVFEPVESHVQGLGAFLFDGVVGEAGCS